MPAPQAAKLGPGAGGAQAGEALARLEDAEARLAELVAEGSATEEEQLAEFESLAGAEAQGACAVYAATFAAVRGRGAGA